MTILFNILNQNQNTPAIQWIQYFFKFVNVLTLWQYIFHKNQLNLALRKLTLPNQHNLPPMYTITQSPSPAGSLKRVSNPTFGHNCQIRYLESYQISQNILVLSVNADSTKINLDKAMLHAGYCWIGLLDCSIRIAIQFGGLDCD